MLIVEGLKYTSGQLGDGNTGNADAMLVESGLAADPLGRAEGRLKHIVQEGPRNAGVLSQAFKACVVDADRQGKNLYCSASGAYRQPLSVHRHT